MQLFQHQRHFNKIFSLFVFIGVRNDLVELFTNSWINLNTANVSVRSSISKLTINTYKFVRCLLNGPKLNKALNLGLKPKHKFLLFLMCLQARYFFKVIELLCLGTLKDLKHLKMA